MFFLFSFDLDASATSVTAASVRRTRCFATSGRCTATRSLMRARCVRTRPARRVTCAPTSAACTSTCQRRPAPRQSPRQPLFPRRRRCLPAPQLPSTGVTTARQCSAPCRASQLTWPSSTAMRASWLVSIPISIKGHDSVGIGLNVKADEYFLSQFHETMLKWRSLKLFSNFLTSGFAHFHGFLVSFQSSIGHRLRRSFRIEWDPLFLFPFQFRIQWSEQTNTLTLPC